jgi:hypothetical protein
MFRAYLASGWGGPSRNTHSIELPKVAKNFEYFLLTFDARHYCDNLSWKLKDASGFQRTLPYFFNKKDSDGLSITVDGAAGDYKYECTLEAWPKELQMPIAKFYSISTVQICPQEKCLSLPSGRYRRKGTKHWTMGSRITFANLQAVYESQLIYKLHDGTIVESPILEVTCMWQSFNIEKESVVDLEEMMLRKKFAISINETSVFNTDYTTTIRLISPTNVEGYDKEIVLKSRKDQIDRKDIPVILGARYEFKLNVENFAVSYTRVIQAPSAYVDNNLWKTHFGTMDQVTFHERQSKIATRWIDWYAGEGEDYDSEIEEWQLILYKYGAYSYKYTFQPDLYQQTVEKLFFGGSFTLTTTSPDNTRIDILKLFSRKVTGKVNTSTVNFPDIEPQTQSPAPLQLPELLKYIVQFTENLTRMQCRNVCKAWCKLILPTTSGTLTSKTITILGQTLSIEVEQ